MEWRLFADLAEVAGDERIAIRDDVETVDEALEALLADRPELEERVLDDEGDLRSHVNLLKNGTNVESAGDGLSTPIEEGDELALFPPVSGG